jgi:AcrR family transcriptional regulator
MARKGDRGGSRTRARIAEVATALFVERGFEDVTIAEVAAAAGVSKVTVFSYFERKEDLLFDRMPDVVAIVRQSVQERPDDVSAVEALRRTVMELADQRHVLSGLAGDIEPFMRTVLESPALISRFRDFQAEAEAELAAVLRADARFAGDSAVVAAVLVAAYRTVAAETVRRRLAGDHIAEVAAFHRRRLEGAFDLLNAGLSGKAATSQPAALLAN